jgi:Spy/CpxP family protein refolding chaperone
VVVACALFFAAAPAHAQWFSPWQVMEDANTPGVGARQFKQYAELLNLSPDQRSAGEELFSAYEREYRGISKRMQEVNKSIQEEYDNDDEIDIWREVWPKVIKNFLKKTEKLDKGFMDDLRALLDAGQQSRWPQVERLHRRQTTLNHGTRPGEQIDLIDIVQGMRMDPAALQSVNPLLEQYAADLDRELVARDKFIDNSMDRFFDGWTNWDQEKMKQLYSEMNKLSQKIVDVNHTYARQIQGVLPADLQEPFDLRVKQRMFPRVYRKTFAARVIETALALPDLDPGQREGVKGIRETFERESTAINDKWAAGLEEQEARRRENPSPWGWGGDDDPKIVEARKQRKDLEKKTVDSISAILTAEQRKKLPDRKWKPEFDLDAPSTSH